jgi:hypothetical protein
MKVVVGAGPTECSGYLFGSGAHGPAALRYGSPSSSDTRRIARPLLDLQVLCSEGRGGRAHRMKVVRSETAPQGSTSPEGAARASIRVA